MTFCWNICTHIYTTLWVKNLKFNHALQLFHVRHNQPGNKHGAKCVCQKTCGCGPGTLHWHLLWHIARVIIPPQGRVPLARLASLPHSLWSRSITLLSNHSFSRDRRVNGGRSHLNGRQRPGTVCRAHFGNSFPISEDLTAGTGSTTAFSLSLLLSNYIPLSFYSVFIYFYWAFVILFCLFICSPYSSMIIALPATIRNKILDEWGVLAAETRLQKYKPHSLKVLTYPPV